MLGQQKKTEEALFLAQRAVAKHNIPAFHYILGVLHASQGHASYKKARECLQRGLLLNPQHHLSTMKLAELSGDEGDFH